MTKKGARISTPSRGMEARTSWFSTSSSVSGLSSDRATIGPSRNSMEALFDLVLLSHRTHRPHGMHHSLLPNVFTKHICYSIVLPHCSRC